MNLDFKGNDSLRTQLLAYMGLSEENNSADSDQTQPETEAAGESGAQEETEQQGGNEE